MNPICRRVGRWLLVTMLIITSGGSTFVLSGCDPQVSALVLTGFQDLSVTFVDAFFTLLANQAAEDQAQNGGGTATGSGTTP